MPENKKVAKRGGAVAGKVRKISEIELTASVISKKNFLSPRKIIRKLK